MNTKRIFKTAAPISILVLLAGTTSATAQVRGTDNQERPRHAQQDQAAQTMYMLAADLRGKNVVNAQGEGMGKITDLIIHTKKGAAQYAVVSFGGFLGMGRDSIAVPMAAFTWDRAEERFILDTTKERLEKAPDFDSDNWNQLRDPTWREQIRRTFGHVPSIDDDRAARGMDRNPRDPEQDRDRRNPSDQRAVDRFGTYMLSTDLEDATLVGSNGEGIGDIDDLVVDRSSGHIGFVTLKTGGVLGIGAETRVVPWEALTRTDENEFRISIASNRIENAPQFDSSRIADLNNRQSNQRIYAYYQVQPREIIRDGQRPTDTQYASSGQKTYILADGVVGSDVYNRQGEDLGSIDDLIISVNRGSTPYAIVSFGGVLGVGRDLVAVPMKAFSWDQAEERYVLDTTRERLDSAPDFDSENWDQLKDRNWRERVRRAFGQVPELENDRSARDRQPREGDRPNNPNQRDRDQRNPSDARADQNFKPYMVVSDLKGSSIVGSNGENLGDIDGVVMDRTSGHIGFITMKTGGVLGVAANTLAVPWEALTRTSENEFRISMTSSRLESAPQIESDKIAELGNQQFSQRIYTFFQVQPRAADSGQADQRRRDGASDDRGPRNPGSSPSGR